MAARRNPPHLIDAECLAERFQDDTHRIAEYGCYKVKLPCLPQPPQLE